MTVQSSVMETIAATNWSCDQISNIEIDDGEKI
jgi:hypothetical protein